MPRLLLLALGALATASVAADPRPYMKRATPTELPLLVETYGCPVDAVTVRAMAEDKDAAYILDGIKERVEAAIGDYVKANSEPTVAPETPRRSNRRR